MFIRIFTYRQRKLLLAILIVAFATFGLIFCIYITSNLRLHFDQPLSQNRKILKNSYENQNFETSTSNLNAFSNFHENNNGLLEKRIALEYKEDLSSTLSLFDIRNWKKAPTLSVDIFSEDEHMKNIEQHLRQRQVFSLSSGAQQKNSLMASSIELEAMEMAAPISSNDRQTRYEHELQRMGVPVVNGIGPDGPPPPRERLVHIDLKGAPPKLSFLERLLPVLRDLGATGFLMEYEDMFPFIGEISNISAGNAYERSGLTRFLTSCAQNNLSVMPLIQTFGHFEYVLKLPEFLNLREIVDSPQSICPSQQKSMHLIEQILEQVIEFHLSLSSDPDIGLRITHVHIGCDEVLRLGQCNLCRSSRSSQLFLNHVINVATFIQNRWPQLKIIVWDDMFRSISQTEMQQMQIGQYVEPMIWDYTVDIYNRITPALLQIYAGVFPSVWAASAYKGAFGESLNIPPLEKHLENNIRWLAMIQQENGHFVNGFQGLVLTGWQRYDHFAVLCELLPISLPSLFLSLSTVSHGYFNTNYQENSLFKVLECRHDVLSRPGHPWLHLQKDTRPVQLFLTCKYLCSEIYLFAGKLQHTLQEIRFYLHRMQEDSAWMSDYNVRHGFSSNLAVENILRQTNEYIVNLREIIMEFQKLFHDIYDKFTLAEFMEQKIYPILNSLERHWTNGSTLLRQREWPKRPLPISKKLHDGRLL